jgi:hypothetical protein
MSKDSKYIEIFVNNKYEVLTNEGFEDFSGIGISKNTNYIKIVFDNEAEITVTSEHCLFDLNKNPKSAKDIKPYDFIWCIGGFISVKSVEKLDEDLYAYDLINVKNEKHSYITNNVTSQNCLFLDEFAFVPQEIANDFFASVYPTITRDPNAKIIIVSTPNGLNHFYDIYKGAVSNENNFRPIKVNWWEVEGQDDEWKKKIIRDLGLVRFQQEYGAKFLGSSSTLIEAECLERIKTKNAIDTKYGGLMQLFEHPQVGKHHYILGIDSAGGTGADYSVIQVFKIVSHTEIYQVATYANNMISPHNFAEICIGISDYYLQAGMMVENNEMGGQVADKIWYDFECDRVFNTDPKGIGTRSTRKSKLIANMLTKRYIEEGWLKLNNAETVRQFGMYEEVTPNVFRGPRTDHDDQVTSIIWGLYYLQTPFFEGDLTSVRRSISEVYKIIPDEEADRAMLKKKSLSRGPSSFADDDGYSSKDEDDEGIRPPVMDDDDDSFEWPNSLDD